MSKLILKVSDKDSKRKMITGSMVQDDDFFVDPELHIEIKSEDEFNNIRKILSEGGEVTYESEKKHPKTIDMSVSEVSDLKQAKIKATSMATHQLAQRFNSSATTLTTIEYMITLTELFDAGFFITDTNREEKYLEIINSGDETIISLLERYLEAWDDLQSSKYFYKKFRKFRRMLGAADTIEGADEILDEFLSIFT